MANDNSKEPKRSEIDRRDVRPEHYGGKDNPHEVIKCLEAWGLVHSFNLGNVVKYVARSGKKGALLDDLKKARTYLDFEIDRLEREFDKLAEMRKAPEPKEIR